MATKQPAEAGPAPPAWRDALHYPLSEAALATNLVLVGFRLLASVLPVWGLPLHALTWFWLYKYGLEALAASAEGRDDAPEGWSHVDRGLHRSHYWLQALLLVALLASTRLAAPPQQYWLLAGLALVLPGAVLVLAMSQNLAAALNPFHWLRVALGIGPAYAGLAAGAALVLAIQAYGGPWLETAPGGLLSIALFYLLAHHLALSLFRLMGLAWRNRASAFEQEGEPGPERRAHAHSRHQGLLRSEALSAPAAASPSGRAAQLAPLLLRGAPDDLHREYRQCLRASGDIAALVEHARVRSCELVALGNERAAIALAHEALGDDPDFHLPDAGSTSTLMQQAETLGLLRLAAQLGANYRRAWPRRYDGLPLALAAARIHTECLQEPEQALRLLRAAWPLTEAGVDRETFEAAIRRAQGDPGG
jgi:hypothetical protein